MILVIVIILITLAVLVGHTFFLAQRKPDNDPAAFLRFASLVRPRKTIVCVGDSITHGRASSNYVDRLSHKLQNQHCTIVNAGINSELAYNILSRIDDIIRCCPAYITILIGTNDAVGAANSIYQRQATRLMKLPEEPSPDFFRRSLVQVIDTLKEKTQARIAILSIPTISENQSQPLYPQAPLFSDLIREIAMEKQVTYLPLFETMVQQLNHFGWDERPVKKYWKIEMYWGVARYYLLRMKLDQIARRNGYHFHTDILHLSDQGAEIVADLIAYFITTNEVHSE